MPPEKTARGRGSTRTIATAGLAIALIGVAGAVVYLYLPEELEQFRRGGTQAAAVQAVTAPPKPTVVDDVPDPADVKTRVVVIDAGKDGAVPVMRWRSRSGRRHGSSSRRPPRS